MKKSIKVFVQFIAGKLEGQISPADIQCDWAVLHIDENDAYRDRKNAAEREEFLYYRYLVEIDSLLPEEECQQFVRNVRKLIDMLRKKGAKVVPLSDFELALD